MAALAPDCHIHNETEMQNWSNRGEKKGWYSSASVDKISQISFDFHKAKSHDTQSD